MKQSSAWARVHTTGLLLALCAASFALLLIPLRRCDGLMMVLPPNGDALLRPDVAAALAVAAFLLGVPLSVFRGLRESAPSPAYGVTLTASLIVVAILFSYNVASNTIILSLEDAERTNEPVAVSRQLGGLPTPHTIGGEEAFWRTANQVQSLRAAQYGYPTSQGEPYSTLYAELAQSSLGAGDLASARMWSSRLVSIAPESTLAMILAAKTAYAAGDIDGAIAFARRASDYAAEPAVSDGEMLELWVDATEAYYNGAKFARQGAYGDAASSLREYVRLSRDSYALDRVESDPLFERFVGTEEFQSLERGVQDLQVIETDT